MDAIDPLALPQIATDMQIQIAIAKKMADMQKLEGAAVLQLLEGVAQAAAPAQEAGRGAEIDQQA